jgi:hypothetical protein
MRHMGPPRKHFLRFLRILRNLSLGIVRYLGWLEQAKDNHLQSKSGNRLPSSAPLNQTQKGFFAPVLITMGRATYVPGIL